MNELMRNLSKFTPAVLETPATSCYVKLYRDDAGVYTLVNAAGQPAGRRKISDLSFVLLESTVCHLGVQGPQELAAGQRPCAEMLLLLVGDWVPCTFGVRATQFEFPNGAMEFLLQARAEVSLELRDYVNMVFCFSPTWKTKSCKGTSGETFTFLTLDALRPRPLTETEILAAVTATQTEEFAETKLRYMSRTTWS